MAADGSCRRPSNAELQRTELFRAFVQSLRGQAASTESCTASGKQASRSFLSLSSDNIAIQVYDAQVVFYGQQARMSDANTIIYICQNSCILKRIRCMVLQLRVDIRRLEQVRGFVFNTPSSLTLVNVSNQIG